MEGQRQDWLNLPEFCKKARVNFHRHGVAMCKPGPSGVSGDCEGLARRLRQGVMGARSWAPRRKAEHPGAMSRGVRGYQHEQQGPTNVSVRKREATILLPGTNRLLSCSPTRARTFLLSSLSRQECRRRNEAAMRTNTRSRRNSRRTRHTPTHRDGY